MSTIVVFNDFDAGTLQLAPIFLGTDVTPDSQANQRTLIKRIVGDWTVTPGIFPINGTQRLATMYGAAMWLEDEAVATVANAMDPTQATSLTDRKVLWHCNGGCHKTLNTLGFDYAQMVPGHHHIDVRPNQYMEFDKNVYFSARVESTTNSGSLDFLNGYLTLRALLRVP